MVYAAAVYLKQLLEEVFIQFLCRGLEYKESKVKDFHGRVNEVLQKIKFGNFASSDLEEFERKHLPGLPRYVCFSSANQEATPFDEVLRNHQRSLERMPNIMHQFHDINTSLKNFVDHPTSSSVNSLSFDTYPPQCLKELANKLLSLNMESQKVVRLLNQLAEGTIYLHGKLCNLMQVVKNYDDHLEINTIKRSLWKAEREVEDSLQGYPSFIYMIDVEDLKRVEDSFGRVIYFIDQFLSKPDHSSSNIGSKPHSKISQLQLPSGEVRDEATRELSEMLPPGSFSQIESSRSTKLEEVVIGLDHHITKVIDELTGPSPGLSIVTIAGMGGSGKTTLARKVFHHPSIVYHFHFIAWVNSLSSPDQVLSTLFHSIEKQRDEIWGQSSEEDREPVPDEIHDQCSADKGIALWRSLRKRKYLIALDDLWNIDVWRAVETYFPDDRLGSRILITSRFREFPTKIPKNHIHYMELLDENQSWEMLEKLVLGDESCPVELMGIGKLIATKCGGLRLAIVVIAGILKSIPRLNSSWSSVMDNLNAIVYDNAEQCLDILALSYNYLPCHLKACFLFVGIFPANCEIDAQKLINLWLAEGFLETESLNLPERLAEDYLDELIRRCLVVVGKRSFNGKVKTCFVHELLRQLCLKEAQKEDFIQVFPGDATDVDPRRLRHLIFNSVNDADLPSLDRFSHPRSFIFLTPGCDITSDKLIYEFSNHGSLRVLDMYFLPLSDFPRGIMYFLNLRYLALNITFALDASISQLWKLQTLVVYGPWIPGVSRGKEYTPNLMFDYWKMPWLRTISVSVPSFFTYYGRPQQLPVPISLQNLSAVTYSSCGEEALLLMPKLKRLVLYETKEDYANDEHIRCFHNLPSLTELEILKCSFYKEAGEVRSLGLDVMPVTLIKLTLCGSLQPWDKMADLSLLPKLETLKLKDYAFQGGTWKLNQVIFGTLKHLLIDETDLVDWKAEEDTDHFPRLRHLVLRSCKSLLNIPFEAFTTLEIIDLRGCNQSAVDSAKQFQEQFESLDVIATNRLRVVEKGGQSCEFEV